MMGIYKIENSINHKVYIGQSTNIESRWYGHLKNLRENSHRNKHLQNSWNKYGENNFDFEVIEECNESLLTKREQYWIDYYGGINSNRNYNNRDAGNKGHLSEDTKLKLSNFNKGKPAWNKGLSAEIDERVAKNVKKLKGCHLSPEMKMRISSTVQALHDSGHYDYSSINKKRLETMRKNKENGKVRKVRKDKGIKKNVQVGKNISEGKRKANERKRQLGLPLRNNVKKPIPTKKSICVICNKEFYQRNCRHNKTCSKECQYKLAINTRRKNKNE